MKQNKEASLVSCMHSIGYTHSIRPFVSEQSGYGANWRNIDKKNIKKKSGRMEKKKKILQINTGQIRRDIVKENILYRWKRDAPGPRQDSNP